MKKYHLLIAAVGLLALAACNPAPSVGQVPTINQQSTPSVAQAVPQQDTTFRDAALGGVAGFLLGRATSGSSGGSSGGTVVHNNTTVVKKTIVQQQVVQAPPRPQYRPPQRSVTSRPSFSSGRRR